MENSKRVFIMLAVMLTHVTTGTAGTLDVSMQCKLRIADTETEIKVSYVGDETGSLIVKAPFGEMSLPATASRPDTTATMIRAFGPAAVSLAPLAAVEACVADKLDADGLKDRDMVEITAATCMQSLPLGSAPANINAGMEILVDAAGAGAFYSLSYADKSSLGENVVRIASYPLTGCTLMP